MRPGLIGEVVPGARGGRSVLAPAGKAAYNQPGEAALQLNQDWTLFSRLEAIETDELGLIHHGPVEEVTRATLGVSRDFRLSDKLVMAIGASATQNWVSDALSPLYDGDPTGALAFVRFKIM